MRHMRPADLRVEEHYTSTAGFNRSRIWQNNPDCGIFCWAADPIVVFGSNVHEMLKLIERWGRQRRSRGNGSPDLLKEPPEFRGGCYQLHSWLARRVSPSVFCIARDVNKLARSYIQPFARPISLRHYLDGSRDQKKTLDIRMAVKRH